MGKSGRRSSKVTPSGGKVPTMAEWQAMHHYGCFVVELNEKEAVTFKKNDDATILPHGVAPDTDFESHRYWVARIQEIRAHDDDDRDDNVWVRVAWYYSAKDTRGVVKTFNAKGCGKYERIMSNHEDFVSSSAFNEVIGIVTFDENSIDPAYIGKLPAEIDDDTFYTRYAIQFPDCTITPKPGQNACICGDPYNPDEPNNLMRFCPRPSCRKGYHQECLEGNNHVDPESLSLEPSPKHVRKGKGKQKAPASDDDLDEKPTAARNLRLRIRLLESSPDMDEPVDFLELAGSEAASRPSKSQKTSGSAVVVKRNSARKSTSSRPPIVLRSKKEKRQEHDASYFAEVEKILADIPEEILRMAAQPIVRGGPKGIIGNVRSVVNARRLVYAVIQGEKDHTLDVDVDEGRDGGRSLRRKRSRKGATGALAGRTRTSQAEVEGEDANAGSVDVTERIYVCPHCGGAI